jgi:hypothetical protein
MALWNASVVFGVPADAGASGAQHGSLAQWSLGWANPYGSVFPLPEESVGTYAREPVLSFFAIRLNSLNSNLRSVDAARDYRISASTFAPAWKTYTRGGVVRLETRSRVDMKIVGWLVRRYASRQLL